MATERLTRDARRDTILDAATLVFGEKGYSATRMDDVAAQAGIAKGLLYKHFESKDALFKALVDRQGQVYEAELRQALAAEDPSADPADALRSGLATWLQQLARNATAFGINDPGTHDAYDDLRHRMRAVIAEAILDVEPGTDPDLVYLAAAGVQGAAEAIGVAWQSSVPVSEEVALAVLHTFCWGGLGMLRELLAAVNGPSGVPVEGLTPGD